MEIDRHNASAYLAARGHGGPWRVTPLGGGVSNTVLLAESGERRWVLKQSLGKLRVEADWFAARERIHREAAALRELAAALPAGCLPRLVFEDRDAFVYAMQAAPAGATDWKTLLMRGEPGEVVARRAGEIFAALVRLSFDSPRWRDMFGDQTCFDQLRLDPYYRATAARHPDLAPAFESAIRACRERACALVHGDFSPKNLLVDAGRVMLIDFEVIHWGDPAFDAAFLLNHLLLKALHLPDSRDALLAAARAFWDAAHVHSPEWLEPAAIQHLGCLLLARVDGKSPAEYLSNLERDAARERARRWITAPPATLEELFHSC